MVSAHGDVKKQLIKMNQIGTLFSIMLYYKNLAKSKICQTLNKIFELIINISKFIRLE